MLQRIAEIGVQHQRLHAGVHGLILLDTDFQQVIALKEPVPVFRQSLILPLRIGHIHRRLENVANFAVPVENRLAGQMQIASFQGEIDLLRPPRKPDTGMGTPRRRLRTAAQGRIALFPDQLPDRHIFGGGINADDVVIQIENRQRDVDILHQLFLQRNRVGHQLHLPLTLPGQHEQVSGAAERLAVGGGDRMALPHEIQSEHSP